MNQTLSKTIVYGSMLAWTLLGLACAVPAMFSVMMFDAPGSTSSPATVALVAALMSFPFICALTVGNVWHANRTGDVSAAYRWACLPLVNLAVGGAATLWIMLMQAGKFGG